MSGPVSARMAALVSATWPAAAEASCGPFIVPRGEGGGNRVSAARLAEAGASGEDVTPVMLDTLRDAQLGLGQEDCVLVLPGQEALDQTLAAAGYTIRDPVLFLDAPVAEVAATPPPVTCFTLWPPLAVQEEIWAAGGIGPARLAIMARAAEPKTTLLGRLGDRPAGAAFIGVNGSEAMLHALEVAPFARRAGLARRMVQAGAQWAAEAGATRLSVLVTRENLPARGLYASLRLQAVGHYHYRVR